jgi:hypothetical protein
MRGAPETGCSRQPALDADRGRARRFTGAGLTQQTSLLSMHATVHGHGMPGHK